ncbi:hypothetical protein C8R44DRAFT_788033 [Mycena epipterygia]|nr:hypothetical protein C8R44DRAFT_788033 [Mycena epipterygia]
MDAEKLIRLMEEQLNVLHRINERQAAADVSTQPILQVPATSSSTWGALLRSRIAETIQPKVDQWCSGLDALLVFLGLFSAFLVESLTGLQQDEAARTNELLANLTEIIIQLSAGANVSALKVVSPAPFQPDAVDVRLNSYWSISLILSLSIAALAVACRGFLNMVTVSSYEKAVDRLIDINTRWKAVDKILRPAIEITRQLLVVPVILFVVGLLDSILSSILGLEVIPPPIVAAAGLSLFFIAGVVVFLSFTLLDATVRPENSPFPSTFARVIRKTFQIVTGSSKCTTSPIRMMAFTYHEVVQATHDDETLDKAAAALLGMLDSVRPTKYRSSLEHEARNTLDHLLSPEASIRCNVTASQIIVHLEHIFRPSGEPSSSPLDRLLDPLARAARRSVHYRPMATLWTHRYIKALAVIVGAFRHDHPPVVCILGSSYMSHRYVPTPVVDLLFDVFFDYFHSVSPDGSLPPDMVQLFEPDFIGTEDVLGLLPRLLPRLRLRDNDDDKLILISLLMAAKTPAAVISAAHKRIVNTDFLHPNFVVAWATGGLVVEEFLRRPEGEGDDDHLLADLCSACIFAVQETMERRRKEMFKRGYIAMLCLDTLQTMETAFARLPSSPASAALVDLMADLTRSPAPLILAATPDTVRPGAGLSGGQDGGAVPGGNAVPAVCATLGGGGGGEGRLSRAVPARARGAGAVPQRERERGVGEATTPNSSGSVNGDVKAIDPHLGGGKDDEPKSEA